MEHVFGRYVECPYTYKTVFYKHEEYPNKILQAFDSGHFSLYIKPESEYILHYDPICGRDKTITLGDTFKDGTPIKECYYKPCLDLVYYYHDFHHNGPREIDFQKIPALQFTVINNQEIEDSLLSIDQFDQQIDTFVNCFTNFRGINYLRGVLKDPSKIYKLGEKGPKKMEMKADYCKISKSINNRTGEYIETHYY